MVGIRDGWRGEAWYKIAELQVRVTLNDSVLIMIVLVSLSQDKILRGLNNRNHLLTVLEAGSL